MKFLASDFNEEHDDILELIGIDKYVELLKLRGGTYVYFPQYECAVIEDRNRDITKKFNGVNAQMLAREYSLTENYARKVLRGEGVL